MSEILAFLFGFGLASLLLGTQLWRGIGGTGALLRRREAELAACRAEGEARERRIEAENAELRRRMDELADGIVRSAGR